MEIKAIKSRILQLLLGVVHVFSCGKITTKVKVEADGDVNINIHYDADGENKNIEEYNN